MSQFEKMALSYRIDGDNCNRPKGCSQGVFIALSHGKVALAGRMAPCATLPTCAETDMAEQITVMLSSTIRDMPADRDAVVKSFSQTPFVTLWGAEPIREKSVASSPHIGSLELACNCDFYLLLLGERYGDATRDGKSATEAEFDEAYRDNPTKILVFEKEGVVPEERQKTFIERVSDYYKGYWVTKYLFTHDLQGLVLNSFLSLLKERASIGHRLTYLDHFVRCAIQQSPSPEARVYYSVREEVLEFTYLLFGKQHTVHFQKELICNDFWGCLASLKAIFETWR